MKISSICAEQKEYFKSNASRNIEFRLAALLNLKKAINKYEDEINDALKTDLGKSPFEAYMSEIGMVLAELSYMRRHLRRFSKKNKKLCAPAQAFSKCYEIAEPYGTVLIISPWNYPFLLTMGPLIDALAAGNTAVVKPSSMAPATSNIVRKIISEYLPPYYVAVTEGGREENAALLDQPFDYIFFTGCKTVGKQVLRKAAKYLTPVTLELGGKNPCIVDSTANIQSAARSIVFGKYLNLGQTCIAPDYLLVDNTVKDKLLVAIKEEIVRQYGEKPLENPDYGKIINESHFQRLKNLYAKESVYCGGVTDEHLRIEPTVVDNISLKSPIMKQEVFGPILPVLGFDTLDQVPAIVDANPTPLALYLFTTNDHNKRLIFDTIPFGGGCINDTIIHIANSRLRFGGVGSSGMGAYHGKAGFDIFSHYKSVIEKQDFLDMRMRYHPYSEKNARLLRRFLK